MGSDHGANDLLLALMRYAPLLFVVAGILVVGWLARQRSPTEIRTEVLDALSDTEVLSLSQLRHRLTTPVDLETLARVLDELRTAGLVVRWYETIEAERQLVYRRVRVQTAS